MTELSFKLNDRIRVKLPTPPRVAAVQQLQASAEAHGLVLLRLPTVRNASADEWDKSIGCVCRKARKRR